MRTTVTLDPDVLHLLQATMREQGLPFKQVLNRAIRQGLSQGGLRERPAFVVEATAMGAPTVDLTKALALAAQLEDEEILHKMSLRK